MEWKVCFFGKILRMTERDTKNFEDSVSTSNKLNSTQQITAATRATAAITKARARVQEQEQNITERESEIEG